MSQSLVRDTLSSINSTLKSALSSYDINLKDLPALTSDALERYLQTHNYSRISADFLSLPHKGIDSSSKFTQILSRSQAALTQDAPKMILDDTELNNRNHLGQIVSNHTSGSGVSPTTPQFPLLCTPLDVMCDPSLIEQLPQGQGLSQQQRSNDASSSFQTSCAMQSIDPNGNMWILHQHCLIGIDIETLITYSLPGANRDSSSSLFLTIIDLQSSDPIDMSVFNAITTSKEYGIIWRTPSSEDLPGSSSRLLAPLAFKLPVLSDTLATGTARTSSSSDVWQRLPPRTVKTEAIMLSLTPDELQSLSTIQFHAMTANTILLLTHSSLLMFSLTSIFYIRVPSRVTTVSPLVVYDLNTMPFSTTPALAGDDQYLPSRQQWVQLQYLPSTKTIDVVSPNDQFDGDENPNNTISQNEEHTRSSATSSLVPSFSYVIISHTGTVAVISPIVPHLLTLPIEQVLALRQYVASQAFHLSKNRSHQFTSYVGALLYIDSVFGIVPTEPKEDHTTHGQYPIVATTAKYCVSNTIGSNSPVYMPMLQICGTLQSESSPLTFIGMQVISQSFPIITALGITKTPSQPNATSRSGQNTIDINSIPGQHRTVLSEEQSPTSNPHPSSTSTAMAQHQIVYGYIETDIIPCLYVKQHYFSDIHDYSRYVRRSSHLSTYRDNDVTARIESAIKHRPPLPTTKSTGTATSYQNNADKQASHPPAYITNVGGHYLTCDQPSLGRGASVANRSSTLQRHYSSLISHPKLFTLCTAVIDAGINDPMLTSKKQLQVMTRQTLLTALSYLFPPTTSTSKQTKVAPKSAAKPAKPYSFSFFDAEDDDDDDDTDNDNGKQPQKTSQENASSVDSDYESHVALKRFPPSVQTTFHTVLPLLFTFMIILRTKQRMAATISSSLQLTYHHDVPMLFVESTTILPSLASLCTNDIFTTYLNKQKGLSAACRSAFTCAVAILLARPISSSQISRTTHSISNSLVVALNAFYQYHHMEEFRRNSSVSTSTPQHTPLNALINSINKQNDQEDGKQREMFYELRKCIQYPISYVELIQSSSTVSAPPSVHNPDPMAHLTHLTLPFACFTSAAARTLTTHRSHLAYNLKKQQSAGAVFQLYSSLSMDGKGTPFHSYANPQASQQNTRQSTPVVNHLDMIQGTPIALYIAPIQLSSSQKTMNGESTAIVSCIPIQTSLLCIYEMVMERLLEQQQALVDSLEQQIRNCTITTQASSPDNADFLPHHDDHKLVEEVYTNSIAICTKHSSSLQQRQEELDTFINLFSGTSSPLNAILKRVEAYRKQSSNVSVDDLDDLLDLYTRVSAVRSLCEKIVPNTKDHMKILEAVIVAQLSCMESLSMALSELGNFQEWLDDRITVTQRLQTNLQEKLGRLQEKVRQFIGQSGDAKSVGPTHLAFADQLHAIEQRLEELDNKIAMYHELRDENQQNIFRIDLEDDYGMNPDALQQDTIYASHHHDIQHDTDVTATPFGVVGSDPDNSPFASESSTKKHLSENQQRAQHLQAVKEQFGQQLQAILDIKATLLSNIARLKTISKVPTSSP